MQNTAVTERSTRTRMHQRQPCATGFERSLLIPHVLMCVVLMCVVLMCVVVLLCAKLR